MPRRVDSDDLTLRVGVRARLLRGDDSVLEVSRRAGLTNVEVAHIETGVHSPNAATVRKLAIALDVKPADLLNADSRDDLGAIYELLRIVPGQTKMLVDRLRQVT